MLTYAMSYSILNLPKSPKFDSRRLFEIPVKETRMHNSIVALDPEVLIQNAFSDHIRNRFTDVDLTKGQIIERYPNPCMVGVRFPVKPEEAWRASDLCIDLAVADLLPTVEIDCNECNGEGKVEVEFYGDYETGLVQCQSCNGAGTVFVPVKNTPTVSELIARGDEILTEMKEIIDGIGVPEEDRLQSNLLVARQLPF